jgi:hypothetical protein
VNALPDDLKPDERTYLTGLVCPECSGSLSARLEGEGRHLSFECRIGHAFALPELLAAKEHDLETQLWRSVYLVEELEALLSDLERRRPGPWPPPSVCRERIATLRDHAVRLRGLIASDRPLAQPVDDLEPPGGDPDTS